MFLRKIDLRLFEGEGSEGSAEGAINLPGSTRQDSGDIAKVVYGKAPAADGAVQPEGNKGSAAGNDGNESKDGTQEARTAEYQELIKGKFKDLYDRDVQGLINRRFAQNKQSEKELNNQLGKKQAVLDLLQVRYGTNDPDQLASLIENDNSIWTEAAEKEGMTVEQYRKMKALEASNARLLAHEQQQEIEARQHRQVSTWLSEEQALQQKIPGFSLQQEIQNEDFLNLLKARIPMEMAYRVIHHDEIINSVVNSTEKAVMNDIRARGSRPAENGSKSQSAAVARKDDVNKLTGDDLDEIARRVARGERIEF